MNNEIKELLFLLHNDRLTEAGERKLEQEIERLNIVINELEKFLIQLNTKIKEITNVPFDVKEIMEQLDKLQELKGVDKE